MSVDIARLSFAINTNDLKKAKVELGKLEKQGKDTTKSTQLLTAANVALASSVYLIAKSFSKVLSDGLAYNKQIEQSKASIIALSVATQDKAIPATERYAKAQKEALVTLKELQRVNVQTPHTLEQTNKIYTAMYASMKNVGASTADMVELTRSISIASGAANIEFNSLLAGVDGLASGTVLANSDLGRFLSSLGLTNKTLQESDDVVKTVITALKDFKALGTITEATSNFDNAWSQLSGKMTEGVFDGAKDGLNNLSDIINSMSDEDIKNLQKGMNDFGVVALNVAYGTSTALVELTNAFDSLGARIAAVAFRLENGIFLNDAESKALENMYQRTKDNISARDKFVEGLKASKDAMKKGIQANEALSTSQKKLNDVTGEYDINAKGIKNITEAKKKEIEATNKLEKEGREKALQGIQNIMDLNKQRYEQEQQEKIDAIDLTLKQQLMELNFRGLQAELLDDNTDRAIALADINMERIKVEMDAELAKGNITQANYDRALDLNQKLTKKVKDGFEGMGKVMQTMTDSLETNMGSFFDFADKGFMDFGKLAQNVLNDILKQMMMMNIIKPLAGAITTGVSSYFGATANANGGVYNSPSLSAYSGQVVNQTTPFMFANGGVPNLGIMGEAGSEAIMPLTRTSGGELGVKAVGGNSVPTIIVNIENNTGSEMETSQGNLSFNGEAWVLGIVASGVSRNKMGMRDIIKGVR